ncbi:MAG: HEAT repeat domain-containing protein, partial [Nitrospirales bacterium]
MSRGRTTRALLAGGIVLPVVLAVSGTGVGAGGAHSSERLLAAQPHLSPETIGYDAREVARLKGDRIASRQDRERKILAFVREGKPQQAFDEYERLTSVAGREDHKLLREVGIGFILPLRNDMRVQMRGAAYTALKEQNTPETVPYLEDGLSDESGLVRALVAEGLGKLEAGRRSARFRQAVKDQAALVRVAVLKGLGRSGDRAVIPLVERSLSDEQAIVRVAAAGALVALGQAGHWSSLEKAASAHNRLERRAALRMLGELRDPRALPILKGALRDPQPSIRGAAAAALGDLGLPEAVPALIGILSEGVPGVRSVAAVSLGKIGSDESE